MTRIKTKRVTEMGKNLVNAKRFMALQKKNRNELLSSSILRIFSLARFN
jgi:hypothetical protein